ASLRSRSENVFHRPMAAGVSRGTSSGLSLPISLVSHWRGTRVVSRKLSSSRKVMANVTSLQAAGHKVVSPGPTPEPGSDRPWNPCRAVAAVAAEGAPRIVAREASLSGGACALVAPAGEAAAVLRVRRIAVLHRGRCAA